MAGVAGLGRCPVHRPAGAAVARPEAQGGFFGPGPFRYDPERYAYVCPAGELMSRRARNSAAALFAFAGVRQLLDPNYVGGAVGSVAAAASAISGQPRRRRRKGRSSGSPAEYFGGGDGGGGF